MGEPSNEARARSTTEHADFPAEREFREMVRRLADIGYGYGRMAQIVDEEWRNTPRDIPESGRGILTICKNCDTLIRYRTGEPV